MTVFFLVNNDYQLINASRHATDLRSEGYTVSLLQVPHSLKCEPAAGIYDRIFSFKSPVVGRRWLAAWMQYFAVPAQIAALHPCADDVLILYTEYELLNHIILQKFSSVGANVVLIEDGGVGTYITFSKMPNEAMSLKERLIALSVRCLPGLADTQFKKINGALYTWRPDAQIDLLCVYRQFASARCIPMVTIRDNTKDFTVTPVTGRVVFLNEPIYDHYQDDEAYLSGLENIIKALTAGYQEVYFKFHPRETQAWRDRIKGQVLRKYSSLQIIERDSPFEMLLGDYAPEALASYFSTPLLNLSGTGVEPLFVYHLLDDLRNQPAFLQLTTLLRQWNYRFARDWGEVRAGYVSSIQYHAHDFVLPSLSEALGKRFGIKPTIRAV